MAGRKKSYVLVALFVLLFCTEAVLVRGSSNGSNNGNGNSGSSKGNDSSGSSKGDDSSGSNSGSGSSKGNGSSGSNSGSGSNGGNGSSGSNSGSGSSGSNSGSGSSGSNSGSGSSGSNSGSGSSGSNSGSGSSGSNSGKNDDDSDTTNYEELSPSSSGQERYFCKGKGSACYYKTLVCPKECPEKKPKQNKKKKACFVNCGKNCEATCKWRKANCDGYGSLCYDPRFVGGDGVMFYFHGAKGGNFAIVSDDKLQINAHFIGTRPQGRTRDFTWVQSLAVMFDSHTLVISAKKVSHWDDNVEALSLRWDGDVVDLPADGDAEWRTNVEERQVVIERTDDTNNVRVTVAGLLEMKIKVRPIGKEESRVHNYQLPDNDVFAHLETQFKFKNLSDLVEGVLGKTYRPDYVSPVKRGVPMPMMGGEDKYQTPSLFSPLCKACRFQRPSGVASI